MVDSHPSAVASHSSPRSGLLDRIERLGNKLPDPITLFLLGTVLVMVLSHVAYLGEWSVRKALPREVAADAAAMPSDEAAAAGDRADDPRLEWVETGEVFTARSLLTRDGLYWLVANLVKNFINFPPLGIVLVGMLGIGIAERTGLIAAVMKVVMMVMPGWLLTPAMVFVGVNSSLAIDAGYVILPPLAMALYRSVGRPPLAGLAAVFAGVAAGFDANLFVTGLDPLLAGLTQAGAQTIEPGYRVAATCNWYFAAISTVVITLAGWAVTAMLERRLAQRSPEEGGPILPSRDELDQQRLTSVETRSFAFSIASMIIVLGLIVACILIPDWPLYTYHLDGQPVEKAADGTLAPSADHFDRWVNAIVPLLFLTFVIPGTVFGIAAGKIHNDKDVARLLIDSIAGMAPIIVLAFFAAQFTESFKYSGLDRMLAQAGGQWLGQAGFSKYTLVIAFVLGTTTFNLLIGSMSAKWAMFAPIFVPMFMMVGISPELTQAAYRVGDSCTNIITPLNAYLVIILVFMQKYMPKAGMGTLIATMLPYSIAFLIVWIAMLMIWMWLGVPLGPEGPLEYVPALAGG